MVNYLEFVKSEINNRPGYLDEIKGGLYSDKMTGKMSNMCAFSTSVGVNPVCQARILAAIKAICDFNETCRNAWNRYVSKGKDHITQKQLMHILEAEGCPVCVCVFCYANKMCEMYDNTAKKYARNFVWWTMDHTVDDMPVINHAPIINNRPVVRIEALGDTSSVNHAYNYCLLCEKNKGILFTAWTKNPAHWFGAWEKLGHKPENLQMICSSAYLNTPDYKGFNEWNEKSVVRFGVKMFDRLFTVYTGEYLKKNNKTVVANCCKLGDKKTQCLRDCGDCYKTLSECPDWERVEVLR